MSSESFEWKTFDSLTKDDLYEILALRSEVFVLEQRSLYQDIDRWDQKADHLIFWREQELVAYLRVLYAEVRYEEPCLSRLVVSPSCRSQGLARRLMERFLESSWGRQKNRISAQAYLRSFYESYGYQFQKGPYEEDGIAHIEMLRLS